MFRKDLGRRLIRKVESGAADIELPFTGFDTLPKDTLTFGNNWPLQATLPANLPAGKYHVFLRTSGEGDRV